MPARSCDVLVVGGGPAGAACARQLVRAGLDVVVMDKQQFPRDKVCAGWITPAVIESLELDCADYAQGRVMQPIRGFRTGIIGEAPVETRYAETASYGIRRREFDHYLLQRAHARLRLGEPMKSIVREGAGWLVNGEIRTPMVVGAGGHFCPVSRALGTRLGQDETIVSAQEIEFPLSAAERSECHIDNEVAQLYFCADLKGYGWCFPKGDYLNIGLGREDNHRLPEHVERFCAWLQQRGSIPRNLPGKFNGHAYLLYTASRRKLTDDGVLVVGDAAGLAYPQSGEGILPAVQSGLIAAQVIVEAAGDYRQRKLEPFVSRLTARFGKRNPPPPARSWLPREVKQTLAKQLMATEWFARHVVIDRWFLHANSHTALAQLPP
jgi:geranylgeranyl reductase family protein